MHRCVCACIIIIPSSGLPIRVEPDLLHSLMGESKVVLKVPVNPHPPPNTLDPKLSIHTIKSVHVRGRGVI